MSGTIGFTVLAPVACRNVETATAVKRNTATSLAFQLLFGLLLYLNTKHVTQHTLSNFKYHLVTLLKVFECSFRK
jgi:hypothetical protein